MEVDSGQTSDTNIHKPVKTLKIPTEPSTSQINSPDVSATSPLGKSRYGRTRKPKISEDFYNIDVIFESARESKKSPRGTPLLKSPMSKSVKQQHNQSPPNKPKINLSATSKSPKSSTKTKNFVHVTGDTLMTESMPLPVSDTTTNKIQSPANTKAVRKFFKRESAIVPSHNAKEAVIENSLNVESSKQNDGIEVDGRLNSDIPVLSEESLNMQSVDVTKVLKIISAKSSDPLQNNSDSKAIFKPVLKTYSNKRKSFQKTAVVESFGLPDKPIFPIESEKSGASNEPKRIKNLDVAAPSSENEINIVDKKLLDTPWKIASMNTDFADSEILLETCCDDPQDENKLMNETETSFLPKNQNLIVCEQSSALEIDENMNDDKIKPNRKNTLKKESPKKQKQVTSEESLGVVETQADKSNKIKTLKNTSPRKQKHQQPPNNTAEIVSKNSKKHIIQEKEVETSRIRSPRKQKQMSPEKLLTNSYEDSKKEEIKTREVRASRSKSPRKQKQMTSEEASVKSVKKDEVIVNETKPVRNRSPRKQKHETLESLETSDNSKKDKDDETKIVKKPADSKKQKQAVSEESPSSSRILRSVDPLSNVKLPARSTSQKRKHSSSPNKAANLQSAQERVTPQTGVKVNSPQQTPQRKSLRLRMETPETLGEKSNVKLDLELPKGVRNDNGVSEDVNEVNLVETSRDKKLKIALHLELPKKIENEDVSEELDEMNLLERHKKSKIELNLEPPSKIENDGGEVSVELVEIDLLKRNSGKKLKIKANSKLSKKVEGLDNTISEEVVNKAEVEMSEKETDLKKDDEDTSKELDEMNLLDRSKLSDVPSTSRRVNKKSVLHKKDSSSVTSELALEIKEEIKMEDTNDISLVEADNLEDKNQLAQDCKSSMVVQENSGKNWEEIKDLESGKSLYDLQIKNEPEDIELGDLMWAKIGGHPYWPCVVSEDPVLEDFKCLKKHIKHSYMWYHVRFFGDRGRRSWVSSSSVIRFTDKNDLTILYEKVKSKTNAAGALQPYIVKPSALLKWENAVAEAESLKSSTAQERFDFFFNMFASEEEKNRKLLESTPTKVEMKKSVKTPKPSNVFEKEIKQELLKTSPIKAAGRKSTKISKLNSSEIQTESELLKSATPKTDIKKSAKIPKSLRTENAGRSKIKQTRSKSVPPSAFRPASNERDDTFEVGKENIKLKATGDLEKIVPQTSKSILNEIDTALKPSRKGMSRSNIKLELEPNSRSTLSLQKQALMIKERKESRENSIDEPPETFLKNPWQVFDISKRNLNTPLNEVNSECSLSDTDSMSKSSSNTPIPNTYKDQIARQKRNNLFRGIPRHRVCQICKKPGEILKCKGPCNGLFHYKCSGRYKSDSSVVEIKEEAPAESENSSDGNVNRNEEKENNNAENSLSNGISDTNNLENIEVNIPDESKVKAAKSDVKENEIESSDVLVTNGDEKHKDETTKLETVDLKIVSEDKTKEEKIPDDSKPIADTSTSSNKVEIIHIDCDDSDFEHSLTPKVRLTPSTDFSTLSLAEQIDMKMKEVMQKFEKNTRYADSTTDYTSSEESTSNLLPIPEKPKIVQKKKSLKIKHVTADSISFAENSSSEDLMGEGTSTDGSQEINNSISSQGVSSTANSESVEQKNEPGLTKNEKKSKQQPTEETKDDELHITGDANLDCEVSSDLHSTKEFKCGYCTAEIEPPCCVCSKEISNKNVSFRQKCSLHMCGKFYHPECLKMWPQTQWSLISTAKHKNSNKRLDTFVCPVHVCHTCASDNPHAAISRCTSDKVVKCLRCPATYHTTNYCVPAGTVILSTSQIVCPRHLGQKVAAKKGKFVKCTRTINTPWCFICSKGGDLICCETCPTSVHTDCLQINLLEDGTFICEDCETGRFPLYDEIVWVKLGAYRWWPAVILFPNEIPDNIKNIPHNKGEFVVKFFGTHDHYWVHRGRVFLFQEGDRGHCSPTRKRVDALFKKSIEEAAAAHHLKKGKFELELQKIYKLIK